MYYCYMCNNASHSGSITTAGTFLCWRCTVSHQGPRVRVAEGVTCGWCYERVADLEHVQACRRWQRTVEQEEVRRTIAELASETKGWIEELSAPADPPMKAVCTVTFSTAGDLIEAGLHVRRLVDGRYGANGPCDVSIEYMEDDDE